MSGGGNRLPVLAETIRTAHADAMAAAKIAAIRAIDVGTALLEAKELVPHGGWRQWLVDNTTVSERMASSYMRLAASGMKSETVSDLGLRGALNLLAKTDRALPDRPGDCEVLLVEATGPATSAAVLAVVRREDGDRYHAWGLVLGDDSGSTCRTRRPIPFGWPLYLTISQMLGIEKWRAEVVADDDAFVNLVWEAAE